MLKEPHVYFTPQGCRELVAKIRQGVGIQVFLQNTQTCVRFCGGQTLSDGGGNNPKACLQKRGVITLETYINVLIGLLQKCKTVGNRNKSFGWFAAF